MEESHQVAESLYERTEQSGRDGVRGQDENDVFPGWAIAGLRGARG
jgi:hypothetical protein